VTGDKAAASHTPLHVLARTSYFWKTVSTKFVPKQIKSMNAALTFSFSRCHVSAKRKRKSAVFFSMAAVVGGGFVMIRENKTRVEPDVIKYTSINWSKSSLYIKNE
jgi:hypothetical protein